MPAWEQASLARSLAWVLQFLLVYADLDADVGPGALQLQLLACLSAVSWARCRATAQPQEQLFHLWAVFSVVGCQPDSLDSAALQAQAWVLVAPSACLPHLEVSVVAHMCPASAAYQAVEPVARCRLAYRAQACQALSVAVEALSLLRQGFRPLHLRARMTAG